MMKHKNRLRRPLLASLVLLAFAGPAVGSGCGSGFAPISQVSGLRVLAVVADKPYAQPGDTVTFTLTYADPPGVTETPEILWLGPCFDPLGDEYYGCYSQLHNVSLDSDKFSITLPSDIITRRPKPTDGAAWEGSAFVFFALCVGGSIMPLPGVLDGGASGGLAGSFPIGCFDAQGQQLPAGNFVPGYTEVFAFADGRTHTNPVINGISINQVGTDAGVPGELTDADVTDAGVTDAGDDASVADAAVPDRGAVDPCSVPEGSRLGPRGCGNPNPFTECKAQRAEYQITVDVPNNAKMEAGAHAPYETVWVDYFADQGNIDTSTQLISDSDGTLQPSFSTNWIAPPAPAKGPLTVNIWAVVHDSQGGETVAHQILHVP